MKEVYILATIEADPVSEQTVREAFESDEVELSFGEDGCLFSVSADETRVDVRFDVRKDGLGWTPDLLTGTQEAHDLLKNAKGFYRVAFEPGKPQGSVAVFEALWCIRSLLENVTGVVVDVTAFKIHTAEDIEEITELDFDIRDHITLHAVEAGKTATPMWVHSHGMTKFGLLDVEIFSLSEKDLQPAETFFHELCTDQAFGQGPTTRVPVATSVGMGFQLLPCDEARRNLFGVLPPDTFDAHEAHFLTVVSPEGRHSMSEVLAQYRDRFEDETPEEAKALLDRAKSMLPPFKARFGRKGLMEPLTFAIRAPFEVHPQDGKGEGQLKSSTPDVEEEQLWVEVLQWEEGTLVGKLVDGGETTTEWRKGAHVEIEETQINAIALSREGRTLDEDEMKSLLLAERPM